jgi:hypothetical protein
MTNAKATAWAAAVVAAGGTVSAGRLVLCSTFYDALDLHGIYAKLDSLFIISPDGAGNTPSAYMDYVRLTQGTAHATGTLAAGGWKGDGSTGYFDTGFTPGVGSQYQAASCHAFVYTTSTRAVGGSGNPANEMALFGNDVAVSGELYLLPKWADLNTYWGLSDAAGSVDGPGAIAGAIAGAWCMTSTGPWGYRNGGTATQNFASTVTPNRTLSILLGACRSSGTVTYHSSDPIVAFSMGSGLTQVQYLALVDAVNDYLTGLGVNTYPPAMDLTTTENVDAVAFSGGGKTMDLATIENLDTAAFTATNLSSGWQTQTDAPSGWVIIYPSPTPPST